MKRIFRPSSVNLLVVLLLLIVTVGLLVGQLPAYQEWRLAHLPLPALQREWAAGGHTDPRLLYYLGLRLNQRGLYADADPVLRQAVGLEPDSARLRDQWARALLGSGRTTAAFGELRQFAGTHPDSAPAHLLLGKFYVAQNSMQRALEELKRTVRLAPDLDEGWAYLVAAHDALRNYPQAKEAAEKWVALRPDTFGSWLQLAAQQEHLEDREGALRSFARAVALGSTSAVAHRAYAQCLLQGSARPEEVERAVVEAYRAVTLDNRDAGAQSILGHALIRQGKWEAALTPLQRAAELAPEYPATALALAGAFGHLGRASEAHRWLQIHASRQQRFDVKARLLARIELDPKNRLAQQRYARLLAEEGKVEECVRHHASALHRAPDSPPVLAAAADDLTQTGHAREALALIRRAVTLAPLNPIALEVMGNTLLESGAPREAAGYYDRARVFRPERFRSYCARIAQFYHQHRARTTALLAAAEQAYRASRELTHGQAGPLHIPQEALLLAQQAVAQAPTNLTYLRYLLMLQFDKRHDREAITLANRVLALAPQDTRAHLLLAILLVDHAATAQELDDVEAHLRLAGTDPAAEATWRYGRGLLALKRGENALAVRELQRALKLDPEPTITYYKLAEAQEKAGARSAAAQTRSVFREREAQKLSEATALRALAAHPDDAAGYRQAATLFDTHGRHAQAAAIRAAAQAHFQRALSGGATSLALITPSKGLQ